MPRSLRTSTGLLLQIIDAGYEKRAWHGPNLKQSLRGISAKEASWRPGPGRHNIWEIVLHAAYWKYIVRRRLVGAPRGSFSLAGSNWFPAPAKASDEAWKRDRALLEQEHGKLRDAIAGLGDPSLRQAPLAWLYGIAFHDVYHAGQIQLLKRLLRSGRNTRAEKL